MAKLGIKHDLLSEVLFFSRKNKPTNFQAICSEIKATQHCFKIIKKTKNKKLCVVSTVKCEQTRQKETKEVCMLLFKRSLNNHLPGITHELQ